MVVYAYFLFERESIFFESGQCVLNITFIARSIFSLIGIPRWSLFGKELILDLNIFSLFFEVELSFVMSFFFFFNSNTF